MADPRVALTSRPNTTLETQARALARVYRLALRAYEREKGAHPGAPDDVRRNQDAHTAQKSIPG